MRRIRKLRANFIITFHLVAPAESARFEATIQFLSRNFPVTHLDELVAQ